MPSVNLVWEQRALRQRNRNVVSALLLVVLASAGTAGWQVVQTRLKARQCQAGIRQCEERIRVAKPLADRNIELQDEIARQEPLLALLQTAQRGTLRWVGLLCDLDRCVPDPSRAALNQCTFSPAQAAAGEKASRDVVGNIVVRGMARTYPLVTEMMRRMDAQRHLARVRLSIAQSEKGRGPVTFTMRAQFRIPDDETQVIETAIKEQLRTLARAPVTQATLREAPHPGGR